MSGWTGKWAGGRTKIDGKGRAQWVLERMVAGRRFTKVLDATSEKQALAELALFERDPEQYVTAKEAAAKARADAIIIDAPTGAGFLADLRRKGRTEPYIRYIRSYLADWVERLGAVDLRQVTLQQYRQALAKMKGAEHKRIVALKSLTAYLREQGRLTRTQDATLDLKTPTIKPARPMDERAYTMEHVQKFYAALSSYRYVTGYRADRQPEEGEFQTVDMQPVRDVFVLRALCGMHGTEIERLAEGKGVINILEGYGEIAGTLFFPHKSGEGHVVSVDAQALAAAQRLQARGQAPNRVYLSRAMRRTAQQSGLEVIELERLRHSFITWAVAGGTLVQPKDGGIPIASIAELVGHKTQRTTRRFYLGTFIPPMAKLMLRLEHPEDPKPAPQFAVVAS